MSLLDLSRFELLRVDSLEALCELVHDRTASEVGVVLLAGGTDFYPELSQRPHTDGELPLVVDISRLEALSGVSWDGELLRIGAATTYAQLQRHPLIVEHAPLLERMAADVGGPSIQARGTLGGNIATASPAADGVAALSALDAEVEVCSVRGLRRIPIGELQTGYKQTLRRADEVIVAVRFAPLGKEGHWYWRKIGARAAQAISKVALAAAARRTEGRVSRFGLAVASVAPITAQMRSTRQLVLSTALTALDGSALDAAVESDVSPIDDLRSTRDYRLHCCKALVRELLRELGADV